MESPTDILNLPDSPDGYANIIEYCTSRDVHPDDKANLFRITCEQDFWFFLRFATKARFFVCELLDCQFYGKHVYDHPYIFRRCREIQADPNGFLDLEPRAHLKSTIITCGLTLWDFLHRPKDSVAIITWELGDVGKGFVDDLQSEMEPGLAYLPDGTAQKRNEVLAHHWPEIFWRDPEREAKVWRHGDLNLKSHGGQKETSICAMSLNAIRTGRHFHTMIWDDIVVEKSSTDPDACADCTAKFRKTGPLAHSTYSTKKRGVGTRWAKNDTYRTLLEEGTFKRRPGTGDCYQEDGVTSVFHPGSQWLDDWRTTLGPPLFAANMRNRPLDEGSSFSFQLEWVEPRRRYQCEPEEIAKDGNLYFHVDPAKPRNQGSSVSRTDYTSIVGYAIRPDGKRYIVELIRDKLTSDDAADIIFGLDSKWRKLGNPIKLWWWELVGAAWDMAYWELQMKHRKHKIEMREYRDREHKDVRVTRLIEPFRRGDIVLPHRLMRTVEGDITEMVSEFVDQEYLRWAPSQGSSWRPTMFARNDDLLDCMAQGESSFVKREQIVPVDSSPTAWKGAQYREDLARQRRHEKSYSGNGGNLNPWSC